MIRLARLLLPVVLSTLSGAWSLAATAQTTLKIATVVPEGTDWVVKMRAGAAEIEQRTEGRVKFKFYTGGVQGTENQVRRKMRIGQLHGGVFTPGGLGMFHEDAEILSLPLLFEDYDEARHVRDRIDATLVERLEQAGYITFGFAGGGFAYLMSSTPITHLDDMKSQKIWIPEGDEVARRAAETFGIAAVTLPLTDVLTGLQTDLIDTVMGPPVGVLVMQWHTAVSHITDLRIAYSYAALLVDKRAFSRISDPDQAVVHDVMQAVYRGFDERGISDDGDALQALLDDGLQYAKLQPGQAEVWKSLIEASNREAGEQGAFDLELLDEIECHRSNYRNGDAGADCAH